MDTRKINHCYYHNDPGTNFNSNLFFDTSFYHLPLNNLRILGPDDDVARSWKSGDMQGLLTKAKIAEEKSNDQAVGMANGR